MPWASFTTGALGLPLVWSCADRAAGMGVSCMCCILSSMCGPQEQLEALADMDVGIAAEERWVRVVARRFRCCSQVLVDRCGDTLYCMLRTDTNDISLYLFVYCLRPEEMQMGM